MNGNEQADLDIFDGRKDSLVLEKKKRKHGEKGKKETDTEAEQKTMC